MKKFAAIDIGSNTVRLLVFESAGDGDFRQIDSIRRITRLGQGMDTEKRLLPGPMASTLDALKEFKKSCVHHGDIPMRAVATSAVREAENKAEFIQKAREQTGIDIDVIPWEEEARLTLRGVFWKIPHQNRRILTFDIGGGSTEFILSQGNRVLGTTGTALGTVRLTEKFISRHPVIEAEYENLTRHIRSELALVKSCLPELTPETAIGTAGTVTTLAALDQYIYPYDPQKVHGMILPRKNIQKIQTDLKAMSIAQRLELKPLEKGREDLIISGCAIVLEILAAFGCPALLVSEYGLREGIILKALETP